QKRAQKAGTATATPELDAYMGAASATSAASGSGTASSAATASPQTPAPPPDLWTGKVIQLWRSGRVGKPNTAVDVGAAPGTPVLAPVDGTVVYIRTYKLYAKYQDYEVHISPTEAPNADCVVIHITDVCVTPGQRVEGGLTQLAKVRLLSKYTGLQLKDYTADGGDHTHVQFNRVPKPGSLWISTPAGEKVVPFMTASNVTTASTSATATTPTP
ncbi:MAG TPA: M23 family metallopeptidase, partial [Coriobacteriia bacterium]